MKIKIATLLFLLVFLSSTHAQKEPARPMSKGDISSLDPITAFRGSINVARSNIKNLSLWIDDWETQLNTETAAATSGNSRTSNLNLSKSNMRQAQGNINKARDNIKHISIKLDNLENGDTAQRTSGLAEVHKTLPDLDTSIQLLYDSILSRGEAYAAKAAELKTRHDTVKNSIGNIR